MTNTKHLLNIFDSFKTNYPHFYLHLTSGWVLHGLWLRSWNPSPSNVLLHVGSHVRNIALQLFAELWTNAHWAIFHSVTCLELRQARCSSNFVVLCKLIAIFSQDCFTCKMLHVLRDVANVRTCYTQTWDSWTAELLRQNRPT